MAVDLQYLSKVTYRIMYRVSMTKSSLLERENGLQVWR